MKNKKVLIVDDNALNRKVFENIIGHNYFFDTAADGIEAIEKLREEKYDVILMDIQMPRLDGISTLKIIREEEITNIPIIAISAYSDQGDREYFLSTGFDDFIAKPVKPKDLLETIYYHLHKTGKKKDLAPTGDKNGDFDETIVLQLLKYHTIENIKSVYNDFWEEAEILVKEIKMLIDLKNFREIGEKLHILKGNSGSLGLTGLYNMVAEFEMNIKNANFNNINEDLDKLEKSLDNFKEMIDKRKIFEKHE
ncbi:response regulator [Negadavirga shengliensis]|uniref:Response regulator n=1 Tax=Negadavirga shengliensis TaxID=1389218 RepID=A0ABV9SYQ3_9BACT